MVTRGITESVRVMSGNVRVFSEMFNPFEKCQVALGKCLRGFYKPVTIQLQSTSIKVIADCWKASQYFRRLIS